ncbi:MAG: hypothetical protein RLZZ299_332 [Pseudomonadota bacterium]|jgi:Fe-S-cluster containining protein
MSGRCGDCAWAALRGPGPRVLRCLRHRRRVAPDEAACPSWTAPAALDCQACGACCREAYHRVEVAPRDPFRRTHPDMLETVAEEGRRTWILPRPNGLCRALTGTPGAWSCAVYEDRPRTCRDFTVGSANCLEARRRVGLTP